MKQIPMFSEIVGKKPSSKEAHARMDDLIGALTDPIIVYSSPWADTLPGWLKAAVKMERLAALLKEGPLTATDAEALAYIYPRTLESPLDGDWTEIYLYLATKVCRADGREIPPDLEVRTLSQWQERELLGPLKAWIYRKRVASRPKADKSKPPAPEQLAVDAPPVIQAELFEQFASR